ncbi:hypothetical protein GCM10027037_07880 [Mucilaginibacter koreensis]
MLKKFLSLLTFYVLLLAFNGYAQPAKTTQGGHSVISINDKWQFILDSNSQQYTDLARVKSWTNVTLPHTWNAADVMSDEQSYYRGIGWYRKKIYLNLPTQSQQTFLRFNGVNQQAEVYINGKKAGSHNGGYTGFSIDVTPYLKAGQENEVAVRVDNRYNENIPPLTADFTFFGGIYRDVFLETTPPIHFATQAYGGNGVHITTPTVNSGQAVVQLENSLTNSSTEPRKVRVTTAIYDVSGKTVTEQRATIAVPAGKTIKAIQNLKPIVQPQLWSPEHPYLYRVVTRLENNKTGEILDEAVNPLGLRWFTFNADSGFILNGKPCKLIGTSRHQDYKDLGNALPQALHIRDVELLKQMGGNYLRVAHYPQDPAILEMCDKLGIIASVEIPVVNAITESPAFSENCRHMLHEMINQNFNHPSVVIWAYMNEVLLKPKFQHDKPRQQQYFNHVAELARSLDSICRKEDPYRYTMIANHGDFNLYNRTGLTSIPMVVGWNLYQGWYGGDINGFGKFLDQHHRQLPQKPMLVTEYGADADERIHAVQPIRFDKSVEYATYYHEVYLKDIQSRSFVAGGAVWNLADFNSESREETMPHINNKGLLTWDRKLKEPYYFYQAALLKEPFLKIASPALVGGPANANGVYLQPVTVFSNLKSVTLTANGKAIQGEAQAHKFIFQVPFNSGSNVLIAAENDDGHAYQDMLKITFVGQYNTLDEQLAQFNGVNILLGAKRYFTDELTQELWQPDQPYQTGGWGSIGGHPYQMANGRQSYGSDKAIAGTDNDPVYQTQQTGIEQYRMDVHDGQYELTLHFAELEGGRAKDLPYNLSTGTTNHTAAFKERIFNVYVNNQLVLKNFNLAAEYGYAWAISKKLPINIIGGKGITIRFEAVKGEPVLNALQIRRVL